MDLQKILGHKLFSPVTVGVVALGSGAAAGYFFGKRHLSKGIQRELDEQFGEIIAVVESNTLKLMEGTELAEIDPNQISLFERSVETTVTFDEIPPNVVPLNRVVIEERVMTHDEVETATRYFESEIEGWDYEVELAMRATGVEIYIIHRDEFYGDEMGWDTQHALMWYEADEVLAMEDDAVVYNPVAMIGTDLRFGHGSGDPNVMFIRNLKTNCEYEVTRNPGSYAIEVLGEMVERELEAQDLKHSRAPGKFVRE